MKAFLKKQFLFEDYLGLMPYFWIAALVFFSVAMIQATHTTTLKWLVAVLLIIFGKLYHDSYYSDLYKPIYLIIQLAITAYVSYQTNYGTLYIFLAWQIGSMRTSKKTFYQRTTLYLLVSMGTLVASYFYTNLSVYDLGISIFFAVGSPFAARSLADSYLKRNRLTQNNERLETLVKQSERSRIAKDLHDSLGQSFSLITLKAELAQKLMAVDSDKAKAELIDIAKTSRNDLTLVRQIVSDLNKQTIAEAMIVEEKNLQSANIYMSSKNESISTQCPDDVQNTLSAVIREAVTNVIRYSHANGVHFDFNESDEQYSLMIKDDGVGIKQKRDHSFGLTGMQERLQTIRGTLDITSDHGVKLQIAVPKGDQ